jgi:hypothetical protein
MPALAGWQQVENSRMQRDTLSGIEDWLERLGLGKYAAVFAEHEITLEVLPELTEPDIDRLALPTGPRRKLMVAIAELAGRIRTNLPPTRHMSGMSGRTPSADSSP